MTSTIVAPHGGHRLMSQLVSSLAKSLDAEVRELDLETGSVVGGAQEYEAVSGGLIEEGWLEAVVRYAGARVAHPPTLTELWEYVAATEALGGSGLEGSETIVAVDGTVVPVMLSVAAPYLALVSALPMAAPDEPLPGSWALALHAASVIAATDLESWFGLTNRGHSSVYFCPVSPRPSRPETPERRAGPFRLLIPEPLCPSAAAAPAAEDAIEAAAALLARTGDGRTGVIALPGDPSDPVAAAAVRAGFGERLEWLGNGSRSPEERFRSADLILVASSDVYEIERSVVLAAACGKPVAVLGDLSFLDSIHQTPVPTVPVGAAGAIDEGVLASLGSASAAWYESERSLEATVSRLTDLAASVGSGAFRSAGFYSLRQRHSELFQETTHYDDQHHSGLCHRRLDERLAGIVAESLAEGVERPRILDLGCGPGSLIPYLRTIDGAEIVGLDLSPRMIAEARRRHPEAELRVGDCEAIDAPEASFDAVLCSGVLHRLATPETTLAEVRRVLKPGGALILHEPADDHFARRHPRLASVHLCLRHHLHLALGRRAVDEPEPHRHPPGLSARRLVGELEPRFAVERVTTDMRIGYLYDMIRDPDLFRAVEALEATLDNQPGKSLLMVARHAPKTGLTEAAGNGLEAMCEHAEVGLEHLERLGEAIETIEGRAPLSLPRDGDLAAEGWRCLGPTGKKRVLALSDDPSRLAALCAAVGADSELSWLPLSEVVSGRHRDYDLVIVEVARRAGERELPAAVRACRPYGDCFVEIAAGAEVFANWADLAPFPTVAVARCGEESAGWELRLLTVPTAYTALDARYALRSILQDRTGPDAGLAAELDRVERGIAEARSAGLFSALEAADAGSTLRLARDWR